jgi:predicted transcriptional regulator
MAAVGRRLRLLRAHGLIAKVSKTHRYVVTEKGHHVMTALLAARQASTEKLTKLAA